MKNFKISLNNIEYDCNTFSNKKLPIYEILDTMFYESEDELLFNDENFPVLTIIGLEKEKEKLIISKEFNLCFYARILHYGYYFMALKYMNFQEISIHLYKILFLTIHYKNNYTTNNHHHYFQFLYKKINNW